MDPYVLGITLLTLTVTACIFAGTFLRQTRFLNEASMDVLIGMAAGGCVLIVQGMRQGSVSLHLLQLDETIFFIYLLPPIIFNAGFSMKKKNFFRNFTRIMLFGVIGTFISVAVVATGSMILLPLLGLPSLTVNDHLAIGALFSSTDTVMVLQVLDQNQFPVLYSLMFGEGVLNDATTVVLMRAIDRIGTQLLQFGIAELAQIAVNIVYLFISSVMLGFAVGLLSAYIMRRVFFPDRHSTDHETALMGLLAYLSYLIAELLDLSGIMTVFFTGIIMSHYTWHSMAEGAKITTKFAFRTLAYIAETFTFVYVGIDSLDPSKWSQADTPTVIRVASALFLLLALGRAAFVFPLMGLSNAFTDRSQRLDARRQLVLWWGGLMRGAISVALVYHQFANASSPSAGPGPYATIVVSCLLVVLVSVLVFGAITQPLVSWLITASTKHGGVESVPVYNPDGGSTVSAHLPGLSENADGQLLQQPLLLVRRGRHPTWIHDIWSYVDDRFMQPMFGGSTYSQALGQEPPDEDVRVAALQVE
eukprot:jgi/Chlat1/4003/Chrsp26S04077